MVDVESPIVYDLAYNEEALKEFKENFIEAQDSKLLLNYPTVYIVNDKDDNQSYTVYVGETNDIIRRTLEHLNADDQVRDDWEELKQSKTSQMYVIGHRHFNKSLTLDIENRLMHYLLSVEGIKHVNNRRTNPQSEYYTSDELDVIFSKIWRKLRQKNKELFPLERVIKDSAIFKASPYHKLTQEQLAAKGLIIGKVESALSQNQVGQLILVNGQAGTGKTVLMSSLFCDLLELSNSEDNILLSNRSIYLLVNHEQQLKVYQQIVKKLGYSLKEEVPIVCKPTSFINHTSPDDPVDVVVIDEAHLLWTQGKQSYQGKNQLVDILNRARTVVVVFDENQILSREQHWEEEELYYLKNDAIHHGRYIELFNQMRINAGKETVNWIRYFTDYREILPIPADANYDLKVFENPAEMFAAIKQKAENQENGLSRMLATFDWPYVDKKKPADSKYWNVTVGDFHMPWNLQLPTTKEQKRRNKSLAWAEQEQTIDEVGSTFTIQGFDLNYAGVIIGPSVKYRDGKIVFDREASKNKKAVEKRTLKNGKKVYLSDNLLKNELNVLLTRGVNGLYLFAVDPALQEKLLEMQKLRMNK